MVGILERIELVNKRRLARRSTMGAMGAMGIVMTGQPRGDAGTGGAGSVVVAQSGTAQGRAESLWLTLEAVITLLTTGQNTTLLLEVCHADGRQSRGAVVLGRVVVDFVDGHGGVDDGGLDDL